MTEPITAEQWDVHWHRIREDHVTAGAQPLEASVRADVETVQQFGQRPQETP